MSGWQLMTDTNELKEILKMLKRENRDSFLTNYQSFNSGLDNELDYTEVFYHQAGKNAYIIKRIDDFYKLYYARGEDPIYNLPRSVRNGITVFDVFEIDGKEKQTDAVLDLKKIGFSLYKRYHLWECIGMEFKMPAFRKYEIVDDKELSHLSNVYNIFDVYSDMLPPRRMFKKYIEDRYSFSVFCKGRYEGSQIYSIHGNVADGEFVYAMNRGSGVGGVLLMKLIERCFIEHGCKRINVWIEDNNKDSIKTHKSAGFKISNQSKTTYIKGLTNEKLYL